MAKIELKGKILAVGPVDYVGENRMAKQDFVLFVSGFRDGFGDQKGKDEEWQISILGDDVARLGMARNTVDKRAKCAVYVNSSRLPARNTGDKEIFIINAKLASIEILP